MTLFCLLLWHHWRPQASLQRELYNHAVPDEGEVPAARETDILYRCTRCSRVKVRTVRGNWKFSQLLLGEEMHDSPRIRAGR